MNTGLRCVWLLILNVVSLILAVTIFIVLLIHIPIFGWLLIAVIVIVLLIVIFIITWSRVLICFRVLEKKQ
ncbi:MAG TPA: hypothetical protein VKB51_07760 [bacterium]|nr:hypothetical protein [bacterium]